MNKYAVVVGRRSADMKAVVGCLRLRSFEVESIDDKDGSEAFERAGSDLRVVVFMAGVEREDVRRIVGEARRVQPGVKVVVEGGKSLPAGSCSAMMEEGLVDFCSTGAIDEDVVMLVSRNLLLVDDNKALLMPMAELLRQKGFNVIEASSMREAGAAIDRYGRLLHVCILDYDLEGEFSTELAVALRKANAGCFIVMMTGGHYADMGFDDLIREGVLNLSVKKPFTVQDVVGVLNKAAPGGW